MNDDIPNGAQFLIVKDNEFKKVTAFPEFPIEIQTLTAIDVNEEDFIKTGRLGFILTNVNEQSATIKFLNNTTSSELLIHFGERKEFTINNSTYLIELWAIRYNAPKWDQWKVAF